MGEGTDEQSGATLETLNERGMLGPHTVIVHGVAFTDDQRKLLRGRGAALIWCPTSNLFTLGRTLSPVEVNASGRVALGTDSALSGEGDLLDEIRAARALGVSADRIYAMVTTTAADTLRLSDGEGQCDTGGIADVIAVRDKHLSPAETLCSLTSEDIELVITGGRVRMISAELAQRWPTPLPDLQEICVGGVRRLVAAPVSSLIEAAQRKLGADVYVAHKRVEA
jgi:cytosine/adenosine deaminase-related metal-dependent hydrolase